MNQCTVCGKEDKEIVHLNLFVTGSEGTEACLYCRMVLTEVARGMKSIASTARIQGYKACKAVTEAKDKHEKENSD